MILILYMMVFFLLESLRSNNIHRQKMHTTIGMTNTIVDMISTL